MYSECLVLREDPSTFKVTDLSEYFQKFIEFIGVDITIDLFSQAGQEKMSQWCVCQARSKGGNIEY